MKKLFSLVALVACCSFLFSSTVTAQDLYRNYTDCDFEIKLVYGDPVTCTQMGVISFVVGATSSGTVGIPSGTEILFFKGRYIGTNCAFYVGQEDCSDYEEGASVSCDDACGDYNVSFNPSIGFRIYN